MGLKICVIGLERTGVSAAMALKEAEKAIHCIGYDADKKTLSQVKKEKIFDEVKSNIKDAVTNVDILILSSAADKVEETLKQIGKHIQAHTVVVDLSLLPTKAGQAAKKFLPAEVHYINMVPTFNPEYFQELGSNAQQAHPDLFDKGLMIIADTIGAHEAIINLAVDLGIVLGGKPYFADAQEISGVLASAHVLPQISAAALAMAIIDQPGWMEGMRFAGREFVQQTVALADDEGMQALAQAMLAQPEQTLCVIDNLLASLQHMRHEVADENLDGLKTLLTWLSSERQAWLKQRHKGIWDHEITSSIPAKKQALERLMSLGT